MHPGVPGVRVEFKDQEKSEAAQGEAKLEDDPMEGIDIEDKANHEEAEHEDGPMEGIEFEEKAQPKDEDKAGGRRSDERGCRECGASRMVHAAGLRLCRLCSHLDIIDLDEESVEQVDLDL